MSDIVLAAIITSVGSVIVGLITIAAGRNLADSNRSLRAALSWFPVLAILMAIAAIILTMIPRNKFGDSSEIEFNEAYTAPTDGFVSASSGGEIPPDFDVLVADYPRFRGRGYSGGMVPVPRGDTFIVKKLETPGNQNGTLSARWFPLNSSAQPKFDTGE